jgi:hypothetical protein
LGPTAARHALLTDLLANAGPVDALALALALGCNPYAVLVNVLVREGQDAQRPPKVMAVAKRLGLLRLPCLDAFLTHCLVPEHRDEATSVKVGGHLAGGGGFLSAVLGRGHLHCRVTLMGDQGPAAPIVILPDGFGCRWLEVRGVGGPTHLRMGDGHAFGSVNLHSVVCPRVPDVRCRSVALVRSDVKELDGIGTGGAGFLQAVDSRIGSVRVAQGAGDLRGTTVDRLAVEALRGRLSLDGCEVQALALAGPFDPAGSPTGRVVIRGGTVGSLVTTAHPCSIEMEGVVVTSMAVTDPLAGPVDRCPSLERLEMDECVLGEARGTWAVEEALITHTQVERGALAFKGARTLRLTDVSGPGTRELAVAMGDPRMGNGRDVIQPPSKLTIGRCPDLNRLTFAGPAADDRLRELTLWECPALTAVAGTVMVGTLELSKCPKLGLFGDSLAAWQVQAREVPALNLPVDAEVDEGAIDGVAIERKGKGAGYGQD